MKIDCSFWLFSISQSSLLSPSEFHLNTLSARASTFGGIVRPICFAVLRLITSSNFLSSSTISSQILFMTVDLRPFNESLDRNFVLLHNDSVLEEQMATLNIKKMPDRLYRKIQARANREHRSIAQERSEEHTSELQSRFGN